MEEIWMPIKNFEGLYEVSNTGKIKSLNYNHTKKEGLLKFKKDKYGYLEVFLFKDKIKYKFKVHRLVAIHFIPNIKNKPCVDHINTNKEDNNVENLRWVTHKENNNNPLTKKKTIDNHADFIGIKNPNRKEVYCFELNRVFGCIQEASKELNINNGSIGKCCKGIYKMAGSYHWYYTKNILFSN